MDVQKPARRIPEKPVLSNMPGKNVIRQPDHEQVAKGQTPGRHGIDHPHPVLRLRRIPHEPFFHEPGQRGVKLRIPDRPADIRERPDLCKTLPDRLIHDGLWIADC